MENGVGGWVAGVWRKGMSSEGEDGSSGCRILGKERKGKEGRIEKRDGGWSE